MNLNITIASVLNISMVFAIVGCASMANMNSFDRKAMVCATAVVLGAGLGAALSRNKGKGAAIGAGAGAGACLVFAALDPYDKERIRSAQVKALSEEKAQTDSWQGQDGNSRALNVSTPEPVQVASHQGQICRRVSNEVQIQGRGSQHTEDIYCRTPEGDWFPASTG